MKTLFALFATAASTAAFAHDSTMPHTHPHAASPLPDALTMLIAAGLVLGGVIAFRAWRKG